MSNGTASADCIIGNCYNGIGQYSYANGDGYVGNFIDGNRTGYGTYSYANGATYVGNFLDNEPTGQGKYTTKSEWDEKKRERIVKAKFDKIYAACLLDKADGIDLQVEAMQKALHETCKSIADDPSWLENFKYN